MSVRRPKVSAERDPVLAAFENAPLDPDALTPEEAAELDARMAKPPGRGRSSEEVLAEIAERSRTRDHSG